MAFALFYSLLGGIAMGTYPAIIKMPSVVEADTHPLVLQCYKVFWVFVMGWLFVLYPIFTGHNIAFQFSYWALLSAVAWVASGLCTIWSTPRIGVALALCLQNAMAASLSFLLFWLVLGEPMRLHGSKGHEFLLAPLYISCIVIGMFCIMFAQRPDAQSIDCDSKDHKRVQVMQTDENPAYCTKSEVDHAVAAQRIGASSTLAVEPSTASITEVDELDILELQHDQNPPQMSLSKWQAIRDLSFGCAIAAGSGITTSIQYNIVELGRRWEEQSASCFKQRSNCPAALAERFNHFGSWMASFGTSAVLVSGLCWIVVLMQSLVSQKPFPKLRFDVMLIPGSIAGVLWSVGHFFFLVAVAAGGEAIMMPTNTAISLVTSGLWGLLYFSEVKSVSRKIFWWCTVIMMLVSIFLLNQEKAG